MHRVAKDDCAGPGPRKIAGIDRRRPKRQRYTRRTAPSVESNVVGPVHGEVQVVPCKVAAIRGHRDAGNGGRRRINCIVVAVCRAAACISRDILHARHIDRDHVRYVRDSACWGKRCRPSHTAIAAADRGHRAIGDRQIGIGEPNHSLAEGEGDERGLTDAQCRVGNHHRSSWAGCIDHIVVAVCRADARISGGILHAGLIDRDHVRCVRDRTCGGKRCRPSDAAIAAADRRQRSIGNGQISIRKPNHCLAEGEGDERGLTDAQGRVRNHHRGSWWRGIADRGDGGPLDNRSKTTVVILQIP